MKARVLVLVLLVVFGLISGGCGSDQVADPGAGGSPGTSSSVSEETIGSSTAPSLGSPTELILGSFEVCPDGIHIGQIAPAEGVTCEAVCEVLGFGGCEYRAGQADTDTCLPTDPTQSGECTDVFKSTWSSQCRCSDGLSTPDPTVALEFPATFQGTGEFYMEAYAEFGSEGSVTGGSPVEVEIVLEADGYARATITYHIATLWECIQGDRYGDVEFMGNESTTEVEGTHDGNGTFVFQRTDGDLTGTYDAASLSGYQLRESHYAPSGNCGATRTIRELTITEIPLQP